MSLILQPQVSFPIVRQIANHTDSTTYYVRAVIRNAAGAIIDTVNLDAQGEQRYQASWQVPADQTGRGSYISIVTSVYTDSGYTTKSPDYGDEENTYLVFDRVLPAMRGGGSGLDSRTVRRIIQEELDKLPKPEKVVFPEIPAPIVNLGEVIEAVEGAKRAIGSLPKPESVDLSPLLSALGDMRAAIDAKEVTPATDLAPILARIDEKDNDDDLSRQEVVILLSQLEERITSELPEKIAALLNETTFNIAPITATPERRSNEKEKVFDLSKISI